MARAGCLLLLTALASAQDPLDPAAFGLQTLSREEVAAAGPKRRLAMRGLDPATYRAPPFEPDALEQDNVTRSKLFGGFAYAERLAAKRAAINRLTDPLPVEKQVELLARADLGTPRSFFARHRHLADGIPGGVLPTQPLNALRHSERQAWDWFADELSRRIERSPVRALAVRRVTRELHAPVVERRVRAARVLGGVRDFMAERALERALPGERDAEVRAAIVFHRARIEGDRLASVLTLWAAHPAFEVRAAALRQLAARTDKWAVDLVRDRLAEERGRLRSDALRAAGGAPDGDTNFYGIATDSRRILFVIDISGSMAFPLDGKGGKREPRFWKTKRELARTLQGMPADVRFDLLVFADHLRRWNASFRPASGRAAAAALEFLDQNPPRGGTNVHDALRAGLSSGADTLFLLTDGEPSVGPMVDPALILAEARALNGYGRVVVHAIGLSQDQNAELLVNLAHQSGGRYVADR